VSGCRVESGIRHTVKIEERKEGRKELTSSIAKEALL
jgi:hypothetical protein